LEDKDKVNIYFIILGFNILFTLQLRLLYLKKIDFTSSEIQSFLKEFSQKLNELNLTNIFGICAINEEDFMKPGIEYTEERKNITVPLADATDNFDKIIEALWVFNSDPSKKFIQWGCVRSCAADLWGHHNAFHTRS
ncbi:11232_t:CDS:1, partial [Dentiscutata erythropus]